MNSLFDRRIGAQVILYFLFIGAYIPLYAQISSTESQVDILLKTLDKGNSIDDEVINLSDILFEFGSPALDQSTLPYLDKVVILMSRVPNMTILIEGHTDNVGAKDYNKSLSQKRAESVRAYLVSSLIDSTRIKAEGFGDEQPLASNTTGEGRAQNRRVEVTIMKPSTVKSLQDLIILANGDTVGAIVILANEDGVKYQSFLDNTERFLEADKVVKVVYSSGEEWVTPVPMTPSSSVEESSETIQEWWARVKEKYPFLQSPATFQSGTRVWTLSSELPTNLADERIYRTNSSPALSIIYEKARKGNWGFGYIFAGQWWGDPTLEYNFLYASVGVRGTYHLNFHPKLDTYVGLALTYRRVQFWNQDFLDSNGTADFNGLLGARYYFANRLGLGIEAGSDAIAKFRVGLCLKI